MPVYQSAPVSTFASITVSLTLVFSSGMVLAAPPESADADDDAETDSSPPTDVSDADRIEADAASDEAKERFNSQDFDGAVELFQRAYELDPQPNYLFNIGRVYEEAGRLEEAVQFYADFVKQPGVDINSRSEALDRLKVLRSILEETAEEVPPEEPPPEQPVDEEPVAPPPPVDTGAEKKGKNARVAGFALLGVGAGALIGGAVVAGLAQSDNNRAAAAETIEDRRDLLDQSQTKALTADILYIAGGAVLLTGVILVAVGYSMPKKHRVAFTPTFGPDGGGFDLRFRF